MASPEETFHKLFELDESWRVAVPSTTPTSVCARCHMRKLIPIGERRIEAVGQVGWC